MDYFGIVKKAFTFAWKYRFLFWLGVLASFTASRGGSNFNYVTSSSDWQNLFNKDQNKSSQILNTLKNIAPRVLGESTNRFQDWLSSHWFVIALVILVLLLVFITLWIFGMFARAGIIRSVPRLEKGESSNFSEALWDGKRFFWRFIGATVLLVLFFLILIGVLVGIAIPLFLISVIVGFIWLVPAIIIFIIAAIYVGIIAQFWLRHIVIEDKGVIATLIPAIKFVNLRFKEAVLVWLINVVMNLVFMLVAGIVIMIIGLPLILLGVGIGIANLTTGIIIGVIGLILLGIVMLAVSGYYTAVINSFWTLAYLEIKKLKPQAQAAK